MKRGIKIGNLFVRNKFFELLSYFIDYYQDENLVDFVCDMAVSFNRPDIPWHIFWFPTCYWVLCSMAECYLCKQEHWKVCTFNYHQTFIDHYRCQECREVFRSPEFNTTRSAIHCFEYCFTSEARLGYTLFFLLLPVVFYLSEFLTLTDR